MRSRERGGAKGGVKGGIARALPWRRGIGSRGAIERMAQAPCVTKLCLEALTLRLKLLPGCMPARLRKVRHPSFECGAQRRRSQLVAACEQALPSVRARRPKVRPCVEAAREVRVEDATTDLPAKQLDARLALLCHLKK